MSNGISFLIYFRQRMLALKVAAHPVVPAIVSRESSGFFELVLVGGIFDFFDGLIARVTRTASEFGGQLDSLADAITFGVAPATLMVVFMCLKLTTEAILPSPISEDLVGRATWMSNVTSPTLAERTAAKRQSIASWRRTMT